jgi:thiosulfate/3-mercaptopyruvate sulfurtransferase
MTVTIMSVLTSAKELNQALESPKDLLLVDTRPFNEYYNGHIPGAVNIDLFQFHWLDTSQSGIEQFESQSRILLSNIGVKNNRQVVFYDEISGMSAARGVWLLLYFSHKKVRLLDGGFTRWQKEGYTVEYWTNPFAPSNFVGKPNRKILATFAEVKNGLRKKDSVIVDARTAEEFEGKHVRAARAGHIPSAINVDWEQNLEGGSFKCLEQLSALYSSIPKNSKIITYCQGGYRAANSFLALKILGYKDVRMYLGSWGEWGNKTDLPIEPSKI